MNGFRIRGFYSFLAVVFAFVGPCDRAIAQSQPINILYLSGMNFSSPDAIEFVDAMKAVITASGRRVEVYQESFDLLRLPAIQRYDGIFQELLAARYKETRFDVLLAQSNEAIDLAVRYRDAHSPGTPIYCFDYVDSPATARYLENPGIYSRSMGGTFEPNLRLAARLFPNARNAFIFVTIADSNFLQSFYDTLGTLRSKLPWLTFHVYINTSFAEAEQALSAAGGDSFALFQPAAWTLPSGEVLTGTHLVDRLSAKYPIPYFSGLPSFFGTGLVGGVSIDRSRMGREAGQMVLSILFSETKPANRLASETLAPILDYRALKRFSVPAQLVPPDARIRFKPPSFWIAYEIYLKAFGALLIIALVALLAWSLTRRREARMLREINDQLERMVYERTEELRTANEELKATNESLRLSLRRIEGMQDRLVAETRDTVLGRIALNLAHEINNPLAAIRTSLDTMLRVIGGGEKDLMSLVLEMDDARLSLYRRLLAHTQSAPAFPEKEDFFRVRKTLEARLGILGIGEAQDRSAAADYLADAGLAGLDDGELALVCASENRRVLEALYRTRLVENGVSVSSEAVERISRQVESLRSYARHSDTGEGVMRASVPESIERSLSVFREVEQGKIQISRRIDPDLPFVGIADASLVRVWVNLFQNAVNALGGSGTIEAAARREGSRVVVEILDSGPGVPAEIRDHLFTPFAEAKEVGRGMGLGLPICKRILDGCGGSITHGERDGKTVFTVSLPVVGG